jgi:hypothetical protein
MDYTTTYTVLDISDDDRAPPNVAYRYHPEGSVVGADGEIPTCLIHWSPAPPSVQCRAFYPWGAWHAGKFISYDDCHDTGTIRINSDTTGCYAYPDPLIRTWHMENMAADYPIDLAFSEYQLLPIDATMGNFMKSLWTDGQAHPDHSEVPNFRILDTVHAPSFKERRLKYYGCNHMSNPPLRPFQFNTDQHGDMLDQRGANSLNLYSNVPADPAARSDYHAQILPTATALPTPADSLNTDHPLDNAVRCRTCETILGEHLVTTANSLNGDGPPVRGRVIKFHKKDNCSTSPVIRCCQH